MVMENYAIKETKEFKKEFKKLPKHIRKRFKRQFRKVLINPYGLGRPLKFEWFREIKTEGYRVYYLIFDEKITVLFLGVSDKKNQQVVIDGMISNLPQFKEAI